MNVVTSVKWSSPQTQFLVRRIIVGGIGVSLVLLCPLVFVNFVVRRSAVVVFGNRLVTGCELVESRFKIDTDHFTLSLSN